MRPMIAAALAAVLLSLVAACATTQRYSAAGDVHALMVAIRDNDGPTFDAHVDRRALEAQIQDLIMQRAARPGTSDAVRGLGAILSGPLARAAGGLLIQP